MQFFTDYTAVRFTGIDHIFDVYSTFCEFSLFGKEFSIKFYGVIIAFGFLLAVLFGGRMAYKWKLDLNKMLDILLFGTIGGILGARLYYVLFEWEYYRVHLAEIPQIWHGGLAIYGTVIAVVIVAICVSRRRKFKLFAMTDLVVMGLLIGQIVGRWGNFMNREAFGTETTIFCRMQLTLKTGQLIEVHPTFLYESLWNLIGLLLIVFVVAKHRKFDGENTLFYFLWYGIGRFWIEGMRTDSLYLFDWTIGGAPIRVSQALSAVMVLVSAFLLIWNLKVKPHKPEELYVNIVAARQTAAKDESENEA